MIGDCNHKNYMLWDCSQGWIVPNGSDYTKNVTFKRKAKHILRPIGLAVLEVERNYNFDCHILSRLGGPWFCTCDGSELNQRGRSFQPYVETYSGRVSEDYKVTKRTVKFLDARSGILAYSEKSVRVSFSASSNSLVGTTQMMGPGDRWMTCYVNDMMSFKDTAITTTSQTQEFVLTPNGLVTVSSGGVQTTTSKLNLMLGLPIGWITVKVGSLIYTHVQFKDYYNWEPEDRPNYYSGPWCRNLMSLDDPSLRSLQDDLVLNPPDGVERSVVIDPNIDNTPIGSWVMDANKNVFISQMRELDHKPFNYITGGDTKKLITVKTGDETQFIPEPQLFYPIAPV